MTSVLWADHLKETCIPGLDDAFDYVMERLKKPHLTPEGYGHLFERDWREGLIRSWPSFGELSVPQRKPVKHVIWFLRADLDKCVARYDALAPASHERDVRANLYEHLAAWAGGTKRRREDYEAAARGFLGGRLNSKAFALAWQKLKEDGLTFERGEQTPLKPP